MDSDDKPLSGPTAHQSPQPHDRTPPEGNEDRRSNGEPPDADRNPPRDPDPWIQAFGGCLHGREVLDRKGIPGQASRIPKGNPQQSED